MAKENDSEALNIAIHNFGVMEGARMRDIREEKGDLAWAESFGSAVISWTLHAANPDKFIGEPLTVALRDFKPWLDEISRSPTLSSAFVKGIQREFNSRPIFDTIPNTTPGVK